MSIERAKVTRVAAGSPARLFVEIPKFGLGVEYGPCEVLNGATFTVGDRVLVAAVSGIPDDVVVLGGPDVT